MPSKITLWCMYKLWCMWMTILKINLENTKQLCLGPRYVALQGWHFYSLNNMSLGLISWSFGRYVLPFPKDFFQLSFEGLPSLELCHLVVQPPMFHKFIFWNVFFIMLYMICMNPMQLITFEIHRCITKSTHNII